MKIAREKVRLKLPVAIPLTVLALAKLGVVQNVLAQGKLVVAIQPSVSSDEMLKKAQPQKKIPARWLGWKDRYSSLCPQ